MSTNLVPYKKVTVRKEAHIARVPKQKNFTLIVMGEDNEMEQQNEYSTVLDSLTGRPVTIKFLGVA